MRKNKTKDLVLIGIFAALIAICSWISIPGPVPFTLQTLGVFLAVGMLGGRRGTVAVLVYLLLGLVGVPVFSGFTAGPGRLLGLTGGYILGFFFSALVMWGFGALTAPGAEGKKKARTLLLAGSMLLGLLVCYFFGTAWFVVVYDRTKGSISVGSALASCVIPFLPFDLGKIALALFLCEKLRKVLPEDVLA